MGDGQSLNHNFQPSNITGNEQNTCLFPDGQIDHRVGHQLSSRFPRAVGPGRRAPDYDGRSSFHDFLVQFELIAEMNGWDSVSMASELAASLRGPAVTILSDLQPSERRDYKELVFALKARFEPENQTQLYRALLKTRLRKTDESLPALAQDIRKLVRFSNPTAPADIRETLAKDCFLDALNDKEIELAVFQSQARGLHEALRVAVEFEAFRGSRLKKPTTSNFREQITEETKESIIIRKLDDLSERVKNLEKQPTQGGTRKDKSKMKCFYCGKLGHFQKDCFQLKKKQGDNTSQDLNKD